MTVDFTQSRWTRYGLAAAVGVALLIVRTWGISETFQLYGDQMRDWEIALRPWRDLPLSGPNTWAGGHTWGPQYYWTLWTIRGLMGPLVGNLPHAGGIGQSVLQSAADSLLLLAIWRRLESPALALGAVLLIATYPEDLSLTATIWNPPIAVAYVKLAIAVALVAGPSMWWAVGAVALAWTAVAVHISAIFVAAGVAAAFVWREIATRHWARALATMRAIVETIAILEIPYILDQILHPEAELRPVALATHIGTAHPLTGVASLLQYLATFITTAVNPATVALAGFGVVGAVIAVRRDALLAAGTILPLFATMVMLSMWQGFFSSYWLMTLVPSAVLTAVVALHAIPGRDAARFVRIGFLIAVLAAVPGRVATAQHLNRMPMYGVLVRGSQQIRHRTPRIARIDALFDYGGSNSEYIYERVLGGTIDPTAPYIAAIDGSGEVTYSPNPMAAGTTPRDR